MRSHISFPLGLPGGLLPLASAALLLATIASAPAKADLVFTVEAVSAQAGSTNNTLEVTLTNTGTAPVTIGSYAFVISAGNGITFTSVDTNTNPAYIFLGHSSVGSDNSNQPPNLPGNQLGAADNFNPPGGGISLGVGAANAVGLGDVHFDVGPTASGPIAITLMGFPATNLSDAAGNDISSSIALVNGVVNVSTAAPEPSSLAMTSISLAAGLGYWTTKRRRSKSDQAGRSRRSVG